MMSSTNVQIVLCLPVPVKLLCRGDQGEGWFEDASYLKKKIFNF